MPVNFEKEHIIEAYKSLISISIEGFRYLVLINGGAAIALLAHYGNVKNGIYQPHDIFFGLLFFILGLLFCGASMFFSYKTQLAVFNELRQENLNETTHHRDLMVSMICYIASLVAFVVGAFFSINSLS